MKELIKEIQEKINIYEKKLEKFKNKEDKFSEGYVLGLEQTIIELRLIKHKLEL